VTKRNATPRPVQNARIIRQELRLSILGFPLAANSQIAVPLESRKVRKVPSGAVVKLPSLVGARAGYLADGPLAGPLSPSGPPQPVPRTLRRCFVGPNGLVGLTAFSHQLGSAFADGKADVVAAVNWLLGNLGCDTLGKVLT